MLWNILYKNDGNVVSSEKNNINEILSVRKTKRNASTLLFNFAVSDKKRFIKNQELH